MAAHGSRFILGHLSYSDLAKIKDGQEAFIVLNPEEPKARFEASKSIKSAFSRAGRRCEITSKSVLVEVEPGTWKQSHFLSVRPVPLNHVSKN